MQKITFSLLLLFVGFSNINAQHSCDNPLVITDGFSQVNITTPGNNGPEAWVTGFSNQCSDLTGGIYFHSVFTSDGDDYLLAYTTGSEAGESISITIQTNESYHGMTIFTDCNNTSFDNCLDWEYNAQPATKTLTADNLEANQTIYIAVGIWSTPRNLNFSVLDFTVTPPTSSVNSHNIKEIKLFPNPVSDFLSFKNIDDSTEIIVYTILGQKIITAEVDSYTPQIDLSLLDKGTYIVKIISSGLESTHKVVKK